MIISIGSSIPTFKTMTFHRGLNVLLADTSPREQLKNRLVIVQAKLV
jgi:hypothetical protein